MKFPEVDSEKWKISGWGGGLSTKRQEGEKEENEVKKSNDALTRKQPIREKQWVLFFPLIFAKTCSLWVSISCVTKKGIGLILLLIVIIFSYECIAMINSELETI